MFDFFSKEELKGNKFKSIYRPIRSSFGVDPIHSPGLEVYWQILPEDEGRDGANPQNLKGLEALG